MVESNPNYPGLGENELWRKTDQARAIPWEREHEGGSP